LEHEERLLFSHAITLNKNLNFLFLTLVHEGFTTETMKFTGYGMPLLDVIATEKLCDREFPNLVTDNDVTVAALMMYDDSAHKYPFLDVRAARIPPRLMWLKAGLFSNVEKRQWAIAVAHQPQSRN